MSCPVLSVIVPTYNRKDMLLEALEGIRRQTLKDIEIIIVDDCSTDGTEDTVKNIPDERIKYFRNEKNSGQDESRMNAFRQARGKYIVFHDDDDFYTDYEFFAKAVNIFREHENENPQLAFVGANAILTNVNTGYSCTSSLGIYNERINGLDYILGSVDGQKYRKPFSVFTAIFMADILKKSVPAINSAEDTFLHFNASFYGDVYFMPDIVGIYRMHNNSVTLGMKNDKAYEIRSYNSLIRTIKSTLYVRKQLYEIAGEKDAECWYTKRMIQTMNFNAIAHPKFIHKAKVLYIMTKEAVMTPGLFVKLAKRVFINGSIIGFLRKITPLRKLWRFIKYRCRGKPYPED